MSQTQGRSLTWFELLAIVGIVGIGVGIWQLTATLRAPSYLASRPSEMAVALEQGVPNAKAAYEAVIAHLDETQQQLVAISDRREGAAAASALLGDRYSVLSALGDMDPLEDVPPDVVRTFIENEVALSASITLSETLQTYYRQLTEATIETDARGNAARSEANLAEEQAKAAGSRFVDLSLTILVQRTERARLLQQFPALAPLGTLALPPSVVQAFVKAVLDKQEAAREYRRLEATLQTLNMELKARHAALDRAQQNADAAFAQAKLDAAAAMRWDTLVRSIPPFLLALLAFGVVLHIRFSGKAQHLQHILAPGFVLTAIVYFGLAWPGGGLMVGVAGGLLVMMLAIGTTYRT